MIERVGDFMSSLDLGILGIMSITTGSASVID